MQFSSYLSGLSASVAGNNKSLSHRQITAFSPGLLPPLVKEMVCALLYVIIHIKKTCPVSVWKDTYFMRASWICAPCVCCQQFTGLCWRADMPTGIAEWTCSISPAGSHLSQSQGTEDYIPSLPSSLPVAVGLQQPALIAQVNVGSHWRRKPHEQPLTQGGVQTRRQSFHRLLYFVHNPCKLDWKSLKEIPEKLQNFILFSLFSDSVFYSRLNKLLFHLIQLICTMFIAMNVAGYLLHALSLHNVQNHVDY